MSGFAAIGECMIELSGADGEMWRMGFAGDTFNTAWYVRALSEPAYPVDYVTAFGDDPFSARQRKFLAKNGIGTAQSPVIAGARPGLYAITLDGAERSFTYWRSDAAARRLAADPACLVLSLDARDLVYFSGITLAILSPHDRETLIASIAEARRAGSRVAFDPNVRLRLWKSADEARGAVDEALRICDIALPTFPDEQALYGDKTPEATADRLTALGAGEIVVKNGTEPALVVAGDAREWVPAIEAKAVDTTGAGDSFNGAWLAARLQGDDPLEAARKAHRVAAAVVGVHGALAPMHVARAAFAGK